MNVNAVSLIPWRTIGLISLGSALLACSLVAARRKWPFLAVRTITTVVLLAGVGFSIWLVFKATESPIQVSQIDNGRYIQEVFVDPSPVLAFIPAAFGGISGGIYEYFLRRRERRVA